MQKLHSAIIESFPEAIVDMKYRMPTYQVGEGWVAIANQKNYVSLYTCSSEHLSDFKTKYPAIKTGKGCINFRECDNVPVTGVKKVIRKAMLNPKN